MSKKKEIFKLTYDREYTVPDLKNVHHISLDRPGKLWASDDRGKLVQIDLQGNQLRSGPQNNDELNWDLGGYHSVTLDGDFLYTDKSIIKKFAPDGTTTDFINTGKWTPLSIHCCKNGDVLVGMIWQNEAKVNRYTKKGRKKQILIYGENDRDLYTLPHYITEIDNNTSYDVCVSDWYTKSVVVVKNTGEYRFNQGEDLQLKPYGICADKFGHIFVCDQSSESVHILTHEYNRTRPLSSYPILTPDSGIGHPRALCLDNKNHVHVGQSDTNKIKVYKFTW